MVGQIVEITDPGHWLNKSRGFLEVRHDGEKLGQVPLDDIAAVIISVPGCTISTNLLDHLAQRNVPIVTCGQNYLPTSWTIPIQGYNRQFQVMRAQASLSEPRRKRAWQKIIQSKIRNQADLLERAGKDNKHLLRLANKVKSGDPENCEAQAARAYWQELFGPDFRRNRDAPGLNAALNYTYAVVRACIARGVVGAGLHPSFSIHHKNPQNPFNLVDDLIEPFRPLADYKVWMSGEEIEMLSPDSKTVLAAITSVLVPMGSETSPLSLAAVKTSRAFADYCLGGINHFVLPALPAPLDMAMP